MQLLRLASTIVSTLALYALLSWRVNTTQWVVVPTVSSSSKAFSTAFVILHIAS